jgi:formyl-CoA transferase
MATPRGKSAGKGRKTTSKGRKTAGKTGGKTRAAPAKSGSSSGKTAKSTAKRPATKRPATRSGKPASAGTAKRAKANRGAKQTNTARRLAGVLTVAGGELAKAALTQLASRTLLGEGLPKPTTKPWGGAGRALDGVRVLDFTHVQSGPTCTQLLAYMGADVIKIERPGAGDITRGQLRDVPNADSLYFTMLNGNKRSITIDSKNPKGKEILDRLIRHCDVLVENFAPGALDRMGLTWEHINALNPRMIVASVKGFGPGPYEDCKVYENVAQCAGGSASTTGFRDGPPLVTGV